MVAKIRQVMSSVVLTISGRTVSGEDVLISKLLHMYAQYAESQGWRIESVRTTGSPAEPLKEIVTLINGENAYRKLRYEMVFTEFSGCQRQNRKAASSRRNS
jgi:protein subunit release factor A